MYTPEKALRDFEVIRNSPEALMLIGRTREEFDSLVATLSKPGVLEDYALLINQLEEAGPEEQVVGDLLNGKPVSDILAGR